MLLGLKQGSQINKVCSNCKKVHTVIPANAKPYYLENGNVQAWDFQCECKGNLYVKNYSDVKDIMEVA